MGSVPRKRHKAVFTNGKVHVLKSWCETCIFRPGKPEYAFTLDNGKESRFIDETLKLADVKPRVLEPLT